MSRRVVQGPPGRGVEGEGWAGRISCGGREGAEGCRVVQGYAWRGLEGRGSCGVAVEPPTLGGGASSVCVADVPARALLLLAPTRALLSLREDATLSKRSVACSIRKQQLQFVRLARLARDLTSVVILC